MAEKGHSNFQSCINFFPNLIISEVVDFQNCIFLEIIYFHTRDDMHLVTHAVCVCVCVCVFRGVRCKGG